MSPLFYSLFKIAIWVQRFGSLVRCQTQDKRSSAQLTSQMSVYQHNGQKPIPTQLYTLHKTTNESIFQSLFANFAFKYFNAYYINKIEL